MSKLKQTYNKVNIKVKKHSPEILAGVGVVGVVASGIMACKATLKLNDILDETHETLEKIKEVSEDEKYDEKYSEEDAKKDTAIVYVQTGVKIVKLYLPALTIGACSIGCILASNNILRKRNAALGAAYMTVDKSFKEYRKRVVERFGEEVEHELRYDIKAKEFDKTVTDKKGKEKTVKEEVKVASNPYDVSDYARFFDECCAAWEKDPEYNLMFLKAQQSYANDKLKANGYLFLNEVYDMLGIPRSRAGQVVGWIYDPECPIGDNYVDFGLYDCNREKVREFINGYERSILLDFNVDGVIWDLI